MISVVIPTYDEEKVVVGCLKQFVPLKKRFGLGLIVSDGGSSDNTVKIAKSLLTKWLFGGRSVGRTFRRAGMLVV